MAPMEVREMKRLWGTAEPAPVYSFGVKVATVPDDIHLQLRLLICSVLATDELQSELAAGLYVARSS